MDVQRFLLGLGLVLVVAALLWPILSRIGLGRLPRRYPVPARRRHVLFSRGDLNHYQHCAQRAVVAVQSLTGGERCGYRLPGGPLLRCHEMT
jgi:hypothetical protein